MRRVALPVASAASLRGLPWSQESGHSRGQPAVDNLKDKVASLQHVLDTITEVQATWVPCGTAVGGLQVPVGPADP